MLGVNRLASAALTPFWLLGRLIRQIGVLALYAKRAFLDGLDIKNTGNEPLISALVVWLLALTVWVAL